MRLLGLALLATLPPELWGAWAGWGFMDWQGYAAELLWTPAMLACQLGALAILGRPLKAPPVSAEMAGRAFSAELLLALRFCGVALACLLPALAALALLGWERPGARAAVILLALAGAVPAGLYLLRRLFAQPLVLWQGLGSAAALDESARMTRGKLRRVLPVLLLAGAAGLGLEALGEVTEKLAFIGLPLAFLLNQWALALSYRRLLL